MEGKPERPLLPPEVRNAVVSGVILGLVAAAVVWYLERFETRRVASLVVSEVEEYLRRSDLVDEAAERLRGRRQEPSE